MTNRWYAVEVVPSREAICAYILRLKGYEVFSPEYLCPYRRRPTPLFSGYLFCRLTEGCLGKIVTTRGVKRVVGYGKAISPIDDREIEDIRLVVDSKMPQYPWKNLPEGSHVHIMSGPLKGVTGILASKSKDPVLLISISLLQRSVAVQLDNATQLQPLTEQPLAALAGRESQAATALCLAAAGK